MHSTASTPTQHPLEAIEAARKTLALAKAKREMGARSAAAAAAAVASTAPYVAAIEPAPFSMPVAVESRSASVTAYDGDPAAATAVFSGVLQGMSPGPGLKTHIASMDHAVAMPSPFKMSMPAAAAAGAYLAPTAPPAVKMFSYSEWYFTPKQKKMWKRLPSDFSTPKGTLVCNLFAVGARVYRLMTLDEGIYFGADLDYAVFPKDERKGASYSSYRHPAAKKDSVYVRVRLPEKNFEEVTLSFRNVDMTAMDLLTELRLNPAEYYVALEQQRDFKVIFNHCTFVVLVLDEK